MPVSRARSTMEAKSLLRWGTMEAAGAKQRPGSVRPLLQLYPGLGTDMSQVPSWLCHTVPCLPQPLVSGGCGDPRQQPAMLSAHPGSGGCWQSATPTLHPWVINQSPQHSQQWSFCSLPHGWVAPGLVGRAHALAHGFNAK